MFGRRSTLQKTLVLLLTLAMALSLAVTASAAPPEETGDPSPQAGEARTMDGDDEELSPEEDWVPEDPTVPLWETRDLALRCNPVDLTLTAPADGKTRAQGSVTVDLVDAETGEILDWTGCGVSSVLVKNLGDGYDAAMDGNRLTFSFQPRNSAKQLHEAVSFRLLAVDSGNREIPGIDTWGCNVHVYWYDAEAASGNVTLANCDGQGDTQYVSIADDGSVSLKGYGEDLTGGQIVLSARDATAWSAYDVDSMYKTMSCDTVRPFLGWNTSPDGSGTGYEPEAAFTLPDYDPENNEGLVLYAVYGESVLVGNDLPGPTALPYREGYRFDGFYGPDGTKLTLEKGAAVRDWATYDARWTEVISGEVSYTPKWLELQARAGYSDPVTATAVMSVTDSRSGEPVADYTVTGFDISGYGQDTAAAVTDEAVTAALTCAFDGGEITVTVAPGLPAGSYSWIVLPIASSDGLEIQEQEFEVKCTVYEPEWMTEYSPSGWTVQALEGYEQPQTGEIAMTVRDSRSLESVPYTVSGFTILCTNCDTQADLTTEQAGDYLTCVWKDGVITATAAPGLPAGSYTWVVMPRASVGGAEIFGQEFTVNGEIIAPDPDLVYYDANCADANWDVPAPTAVNASLAVWGAERETVYCTLDANGGGFRSVKTPEVAAPTWQVPVHWTFAGWNTAPDGSGTDYAPGAAYTGPGGVVLYARWSGPTLLRPEELPTDAEGNVWVEREGFSFLGWFSDKTGGTELTAETVAPADSVWYARWQAGELTPSVGTPVISGGQVTVTVTCADETAWVWCAIYDGNGQMIGAQKQPVTPGPDMPYTFVFPVEGAGAQVFLLSADGDPLCQSGGNG